MFEIFYIRLFISSICTLSLGLIISNRLQNIFSFTLPNNLTQLITILTLISVVLCLKNFTYLIRALHVRNKCIKIIEKETEGLSEKHFLEFIETQENLPFEDLPEDKKIGFFIKEIVYKGNFNYKSIAISIYNKNFNKEMKTN